MTYARTTHPVAHEAACRSMTSITRLALRHRRLVALAWLALTVAGVVLEIGQVHERGFGEVVVREV